MYNIRNRLNVIWTLAMFVLTVGAGTLAVTTYLTFHLRPPKPTASIEAVVLPQLYRAQTVFTGRQVDRAIVRVQGSADFTSCFDWNTKQIYVYFIVDYETPKYSRNEVTVYDTIITNQSSAVLSFDQVIDYPSDHIEPGELAGRDVTLRLKYHLMTFSGFSPVKEVEDAAFHFKFPKTYFGSNNN